MMDHAKKKWADRSRFEKMITIARLSVSLIILLCAIMKYLNYWTNALNLAIPLFGVYYLLETAYHWESNRDVAAFSLIMAIFIFGISCAVFFL